jgi:hypothetical protein
MTPDAAQAAAAPLVGKPAVVTKKSGRRVHGKVHSHSSRAVVLDKGPGRPRAGFFLPHVASIDPDGDGDQDQPGVPDEDAGPAVAS